MCTVKLDWWRNKRYMAEWLVYKQVLSMHTLILARVLLYSLEYTC